MTALAPRLLEAKPVGAVGGWVSTTTTGGVVTVTFDDRAELLPAASCAETEYVAVVLAAKPVSAKAVAAVVPTTDAPRKTV